jgi:flagellar biosynthesis chaperone FliJ
MSARTYTKADLEELVYCQLENLNAMHDLIGIMKYQNELLENANKKLKAEISDFKERHVKYPTRGNRSGK